MFRSIEIEKQLHELTERRTKYKKDLVEMENAARLAVRADLGAQRNEYEALVLRLHLQGVSIAQIGQAMLTKDRRTVLDIIEGKRGFVDAVKQQLEIEEQKKAKFAWVWSPEIWERDPEVSNRYHGERTGDWALMVNFVNYGPQHITERQVYKYWLAEPIPHYSEPRFRALCEQKVQVGEHWDERFQHEMWDFVGTKDTGVILTVESNKFKLNNQLQPDEKAMKPLRFYYNEAKEWVEANPCPTRAGTEVDFGAWSLPELVEIDENDKPTGRPYIPDGEVSKPVVDANGEKVGF